MNIVLTQFIVLILLAFSSGSCGKIKIVSLTEKTGISNSRSQNPSSFNEVNNSQLILAVAARRCISLNIDGDHAAEILLPK